MSKARKPFTVFDTLDFPDYEYVPFPRALQLPNRDARIAEAQAKMAEAMKIEDKSLREAAMDIAKQELLNQIHAHVQVNNEAEEKAQLAKWAQEVKTRAA